MKIKQKKSKAVANAVARALPHSNERFLSLLDRVTLIEKETELLRAEKLRLEALDSFYKFTVNILGYDLVESRDDSRNPSKIICDWVAEEQWKYALVLLPRDCFKSTVCAVAYPLWVLYHDPNARILLLRETYRLACNRLREIKGHLTGSNERSKFKELVGDWVPKTRNLRWSEAEVDISPRTKTYTEASITAAGIGGAATGAHYNLIIPDDIITDKNATTAEMMAELKRAWRALFPLLDSVNRRMLMLGTIWNDGDLHCDILRDLAGRIDTPWKNGYTWTHNDGWAKKS